MSDPIPPLPAPPPLIGPVLIPETAVPASAGTMALMSKSTHDGEWLLPRLFRALCIMGELDLDLTRVRLGPGVSVIELVVFMGQINVRIPQNLRVERHGALVMGEVRTRWGPPGAALDGAPVLRIYSKGMMGAVVIDVVDPNAAAWRDQRRGGRRST
jgi:hypothetical protein